MEPASGSTTPAVAGPGLGTGKLVALIFAMGSALIATTTLTNPEIVRATGPATFAGASRATLGQAGGSPVPTAGVTRFRGLAFDTCRAPSLDTMKAWRVSPYRAIGVYISGEARACDQPHLTRDWVAKVSADGWRLIPIDVSRQAPCLWGSNHRTAIRPQRAHEQGEAAARASVRAAEALGMLPGSALYSDIEHYGRKASRGCVTAVADYLSGWTEELHRRGYLSGMYGHAGSGIPHAAQRYFSGRARPDAVWMAQWDRERDLEG